MKPILLIEIPDSLKKETLSESLFQLKEYLLDYYILAIYHNGIEAVKIRLLSPFTNLETVPEDKLEKIKEILKEEIT